MTKAEQQDQLSLIVQRFAATAPEKWVRLVGNWEAFHDDVGELTLNYITLAVVDGGDRWLFGQVGYDEQLYDAVVKLNELAAQEGADRRWTVLDLEIDADLTYRANLGYDPPKRARGIHDEDSLGRFENYLDTWIAEHGRTPRG